MGDDEQIAGLDAELGEGLGGLDNGRFEFPPRHMHIWLVGCHVDDGILGVIVGGEGDGVEQGAKLGACLLGEH